jgi:hypothetical protein
MWQAHPRGSTRVAFCGTGGAGVVAGIYRPEAQALARASRPTPQPSLGTHGPCDSVMTHGDATTVAPSSKYHPMRTRSSTSIRFRASDQRDRCPSGARNFTTASQKPNRHDSEADRGGLRRTEDPARSGPTKPTGSRASRSASGSPRTVRERLTGHHQRPPIATSVSAGHRRHVARGRRSCGCAHTIRRTRRLATPHTSLTSDRILLVDFWDSLRGAAVGS